MHIIVIDCIVHLTSGFPDCLVPDPGPGSAGARSAAWSRAATESRRPDGAGGTAALVEVSRRMFRKVSKSSKLTSLMSILSMATGVVSAPWTAVDINDLLSILSTFGEITPSKPWFEIFPKHIDGRLGQVDTNANDERTSGAARQVTYRDLALQPPRARRSASQGRK